MAAAPIPTAAHPRRVPVVLQGELSECGLASLAMIAAAWGLKSDLAAFRARLTATPRGISLRSLMSIAAGIGLAARPIRIGLQRLGDLKLPAILHWNMDHFVVLERVKGDTATIVDPARGRLRVPLDSMSPHFTGIAVEFTPTDGFRPGVMRLSRSFRRAWLDDRELRSSAFSMLWLTLLLQLTIIAMPFAYRSVIDRANRGFSDAHLIWIACGIALMMIVQAGSGWSRGLVVTRLGSIFVHRVSTQIVARLFSLPVAFFQRQMLGDVLSRVRSVDTIRRFVTDQAVPLVIDLIVGSVTAGLMILFSPHLAFIVIAGLTIEMGVRVMNMRRQRELSEELLEAEGKELSRLLESIRAIQAIKLAGREAQRFGVWQNELIRVLNANTRLNRRRISVGTIASAASALEWAAVLAVGVLGVGFAPVSTGVLFGFLAYRGVFRERVSTLTENLWSLQLAGVHLRRLDDLMLADAEPQGGGVSQVEGPGHLKLENISFRYAPNEPLVLDNISLDIPAGACVAITGPSGSGKSTLIKLILGIETAQQGSIRLDGVPIETVHRQAWRERFGTVMQDDTLLAGSISENIAFFDYRIDLDKVRTAAVGAAIHEEIAAMPMEYGTLVGDMGVQISGGQRQRVLIARALYREPSIILFDEGTANLDAESEQKISNVLATLAPTRIVVAHKSHLLSVADIVYEVRGGKVSRAR
ncbi:MAG: peptidase domain-containing ABC transporter [Acidobacteriaceae bacterium]|nr:peptidase domain-containing ABC transporter [Acidobacteriaceae bacterium]MBV9764887.1 peptidase domain-containing ABC transporter [Acidobacteriaceae bacterium]